MAKGGDFERRVSPHLSLWWTGGKYDDTVWHTHGSGGRATSRRRKGKRTSGQAGDLCSTDPLSRGLFRVFAFELKSGYQQITINDLIDRPPNAAFNEDGWDGWIEQAETAKAETGAACWCLIHHRSGRKATKARTQVRGRQTMVYLEGNWVEENLPMTFPRPFMRITGIVRHRDGTPRFVYLIAFRFSVLFGKLNEPRPTKFLTLIREAAAKLKPKKRKR